MNRNKLKNCPIIKDLQSQIDALSTTSETAQVLRASSNNTGLRWSNTNIPTGITTSPNINIISLTNTNTVPVIVDVKMDFGDSYMWIADGDFRIRISYNIYINGNQIESGTNVHYNWLDSEPFNNNQQQTEMRPNGTTFNDTTIIAGSGDIIRVEQQMTVQVISGAGPPERIYWYNGQSVIMMYPQTVKV